MTTQRLRTFISTVVNACLEGSLALDPGAYAAFVLGADATATEPEAAAYTRRAGTVTRLTQPAPASLPLEALAG